MFRAQIAEIRAFLFLQFFTHRQTFWAHRQVDKKRSKVDKKHRLSSKVYIMYIMRLVFFLFVDKHFYSIFGLGDNDL